MFPLFCHYSLTLCQGVEPERNLRLKTGSVILFCEWSKKKTWRPRSQVDGCLTGSLKIGEPFVTHGNEGTG